MDSYSLILGITDNLFSWLVREEVGLRGTERVGPELLAATDEQEPRQVMDLPPELAVGGDLERARAAFKARHRSEARTEC